MGLVWRTDGDMQQVTGLKPDRGAIKFVIDGSFDHEEQFVAVGMEMARVGSTRLEADVAERHFRSGREAAVGQPLDGSPVGTLGYALAEVDDARFDRCSFGVAHLISPEGVLSAEPQYPAATHRRYDGDGLASVG